ncbi:hypothetical protein HZI73_05810 [Vallitalea pronyensis]|uniref:Uncharacterized protein n=1 Tax=Vallitalea pronyensis TaxID=1348613 RepID=A0A8J8MHD5_9FIRM|nr:hypothetical protein [Vallitalea pronyensis]QUI21842.1 hypothetical protein HZI73_05810 [Vallitalea pronyensis]
MNKNSDKSHYWLHDQVTDITFMSLYQKKGASNHSIVNRLYLNVPDTIQKELFAIAKSDHAIFLIMLTVMSYVLYYHTTYNDFIVCVPALKGDKKHTLLPVRTIVDPSKSFKDIILGNKRATEEAYAYTDDSIDDKLQLTYNKFLSNEITVSYKGIHNKIEVTYGNPSFLFYVSKENLKCAITYDASVNKHVLTLLWRMMKDCLIQFLNQPEIKIYQLDEYFKNHGYESHKLRRAITTHTYRHMEVIVAEKINQILASNHNKIDELFYQRITEELLQYVHNSIDLAVVLAKINEKLKGT